ncbi:hypothetical protein Hypma_005665 [Hypsizygus marmoreus]|uniref:Uncharacterized protein n=1 Tax=Hypsizygus marmoreus TaxID=39966 RepID=A0A369JZ47_HYPMA|nr:hypothetical protein Hypma_005665 [Hypsizygus marmoreus]
MAKMTLICPLPVASFCSSAPITRNYLRLALVSYVLPLWLVSPSSGQCGLANLGFGHLKALSRILATSAAAKR